jgi:hypothetical protein
VRLEVADVEIERRLEGLERRLVESEPSLGAAQRQKRLGAKAARAFGQDERLHQRLTGVRELTATLVVMVSDVKLESRPPLVRARRAEPALEEVERLLLATAEGTHHTGAGQELVMEVGSLLQGRLPEHLHRVRQQRGGIEGMRHRRALVGPGRELDQELAKLPPGIVGIE